MSPLHRDVFRIDSLGGTFEGVTDGRRWNGWATPAFERAVALRIAEAVRHAHDDPGAATYDPDADAFTFTDEGTDPHVVGPETVAVDGREIVVYPVGRDVWTWESATPPARRPPTPPLPEHGYVTLRVVYEAGPDPLTGELLPHEEETVVVPAPTPQRAALLTMRYARINPRGRCVSIFDTDGAPVYAA